MLGGGEGFAEGEGEADEDLDGNALVVVEYSVLVFPLRWC